MGYPLQLNVANTAGAGLVCSSVLFNLMKNQFVIVCLCLQSVTHEGISNIVPTLNLYGDKNEPKRGAACLTAAYMRKK